VLAVVALSVLTASLSADAQQVGKVPRLWCCRRKADRGKR
jgi:hypothetical protein